MSDDVVITAAKRTPVGSFMGAFATTPAHELGAVAIEAALEQAGVEPGRRVGSDPGPGADRGAGPEPGAPGVDGGGRPQGKPGLGRQPGLRLGPARGRARLCRRCATATPTSSSRAGRNRCACRRTRSICAAAPRWATLNLVDTMIKDGLTDVFNGYHMGITAENVAGNIR